MALRAGHGMGSSDSAGGSGDFEWYVLRDGRPVGPMNPQELAALSLSGHVAGQDFVWCEALTEWVRLGRALGIAEQAAAPPRRPVVTMPDGAPSLLQLYLDRLPTTAGRPSQNVPPAAAAATRRPAVGPAAVETRKPTAEHAAPPLSALPTRQFQTPATGAVQPSAWPVTADAPRGPIISAISVSSPANIGGEPQPPADGTPSSHKILDGLAQALIQVLERHEIRTIEDLANDRRLEAVAAAVLDHLPWSIRIVINSTVGKAACEHRLAELLTAQRDRWLAAPTRSLDLRAFVAHVIGSGRLDQWITGAGHHVARSVGGAASGLVGAVSRGIHNGHRAPADEVATPMAAIGYSRAIGPVTR